MKWNLLSRQLDYAVIENAFAKLLRNEKNMSVLKRAAATPEGRIKIITIFRASNQLWKDWVSDEYFFKRLKL